MLCVRWYFSCKLSYRDLAEIKAERGVSVAPSTILRWVVHYAPEFETSWSRFAPRSFRNQICNRTVASAVCPSHVSEDTRAGRASHRPCASVRAGSRTSAGRNARYRIRARRCERNLRRSQRDRSCATSRSHCGAASNLIPRLKRMRSRPFGIEVGSFGEPKRRSWKVHRWLESSWAQRRIWKPCAPQR